MFRSSTVLVWHRINAWDILPCSHSPHFKPDHINPTLANNLQQEEEVWLVSLQDLIIWSRQVRPFLVAQVRSISRSTASPMPRKVQYFCVREGFNPGIYDQIEDAKLQVEEYYDSKAKVFDDIDKARDWMEGFSSSSCDDLSDFEDNELPKGKRYAVVHGRQRGIFYTWDECKEQVDKFPGAVYKSFKTFEDAYVWYCTEVEKYEVMEVSKWWVVAIGYKPGIYHNYETFVEQVAGYDGAVYQAFDNWADAHQWYHQEKRQHAVLVPPRAGVRTQRPKEFTEEYGLDQPPQIIYTDGCALNNGNSGALAGVGVYYGPDDPQNVSTYLPGERQTNQRAELTAVLLAVKDGPKFRHIEIRTDSTYSIKCVDEWSIKWKKNGWRNAKGQPVENADLIKPILDEIEVRKQRGARVKLTYVAGHSGVMGNENADRLANLGALQARGRRA